MRTYIQIKAVFIGVFILLLALVPACLVAYPFNLRRRLKIVSPAWKLFGNGLIRYACHANIVISEDQRSSEFKGTPCTGLYVVNHQSFMDIPLLTTVFQTPAIMKKEILKIPVFGWMAWISGAIPVSRSSSSSRRKVFEIAKKRILKDKIGLQVYPEGTRSRDSFPKPYSEIKKALLLFAYHENIPVIPTSLFGTRSILNSKGIITPGIKVGIIVHKEIYPNDFDNAEDFAQKCWETVIQGHLQIQERIDQQS